MNQLRSPRAAFGAPMPIIERAIREADLIRDEPRCTRLRPRRKSRCVTGKRRYRDGRETTKRLHTIANIRAAAAQAGVDTNRRECRSYRCPHCRGLHLTSISSQTWADIVARG